MDKRHGQEAWTRGIDESHEYEAWFRGMTVRYCQKDLTGCIIEKYTGRSNTSFKMTRHGSDECPLQISARRSSYIHHQNGVKLQCEFDGHWPSTRQ
jgi:hypothetical protein